MLLLASWIHSVRCFALQHTVPLQGSKIRISVLLRNNTQLGNGQMIINACGDVPVGTEVPGKVQYFKPGGKPGEVAEVRARQKHCACVRCLDIG